MLPPRRSEEIRGGLAVSPPHSIHQPLPHFTVPFPGLVGSRGLHSGSGRVGSRGLFSGSGRVGSGPAESIHRSRWPPLHVHFLAPPKCHVHFSVRIRSISSPAMDGKGAISIISLCTFWPDFSLTLLCVCTIVTYKIIQQSGVHCGAAGREDGMNFCATHPCYFIYSALLLSPIDCSQKLQPRHLSQIFLSQRFAWDIIYSQRKCV